MYKKHKPTKVQRFSDVARLQQRIKTQTPKTGDYFYDYKLDQAKKQQSLMNRDEFHLKYKINFADLPISALTLKGLNNKSFIKMTQVQRCVIPHALSGRDVMAASRTGSGKTLSYLIPLIQKLYRNKFMPMDGLGAIILVPVRQLAMQVFQVLNSFTSHMQISIGLIIGGKDIKYQKQKISLMNVLVCTPGRLLQHLQQTYGFETSNLQMMVIDEADVMLEMGFRNTLKSILENIPKCQTLFFSATLNNQIHKLSQQCMTTPQRIFLHTIKHSQINNSGQTQNKNIDTIYQTPAKLMQYYMVVSPEDKLNVLYSFLKTHNKQKVLIFASTCKQVRFIYEAFRKFRLSSPLYELQGHQNQKKRMAIYFTFCEKKYGILVCTNIASRGLDFPMVDWVIQLDIPEDVETYVHRVGRTARFKYEGKSLAFVSEHELEFVNNLKSKNIKIHKITQNMEKYFRIDSSLQSICSQHQDVKYLAQRALISYIQFVYKSGNKAIFNLKNIDLELLAKSFGLQNAPNLSIVQDNKQKQDDEEQDGKKLTKIQKLRMKAKLAKEKKKQEKDGQKKVNDEEDEQESQQSEQEEESPEQAEESNEQQFLKVTKKIKLDANSKPILSVSKNQLKKIKPQGHFQGKNKILFDQDLNPITFQQHRVKKLLKSNETNTKLNRNFQFQIQNRLQVNREIDEKDQKQRRKIRRKKIQVQKEQAKRGYSGQQEAVLGGSDDNGDGDDEQ